MEKTPYLFPLLSSSSRSLPPPPPLPTTPSPPTAAIYFSLLSRSTIVRLFPSFPLPNQVENWADGAAGQRYGKEVVVAVLEQWTKHEPAMVVLSLTEVLWWCATSMSGLQCSFVVARRLKQQAVQVRTVGVGFVVGSIRGVWAVEGRVDELYG